MKKLIPIIATAILMACGTAKPLTISATGIVLDCTDTEVQVAYRGLINSPWDKILLTHQHPVGHGYKEGDVYPSCKQ